MKKQELEQLKSDFKSVSQRYLDAFVKKQGYDFSFWVSDEVGGICCFIEQYFFNLDDIRQDIDKKAKKGLIFEWQEENLENQKHMINYNSFLMGLRCKHVAKQNKIKK